MTDTIAPVTDRDTRLRIATLGGIVLALAAIVLGGRLWTAVFTALGLELEARIVSTVHFFVVEVGSIFALIGLIVFAVGILGTYLTPTKVQGFLARQPRGLGLVLAAGIGAVTPFCSCSSVPLYLGMTRAGVPMGMGMSFLVASPMVNELALGLLASMAGWRVALAYLGIGLAIAVTTGAIMGAVFGKPAGPPPMALGMAPTTPRPTLDDRIHAGLAEVRTTLRRLWPFVLVALAIGAWVHGWVPADLLRDLGAQPWGVLAAVVVGVPMYSATGAAVPLIAPLYAAGVPLGTLMAFLMAVVALSLPEMLMLRSVLAKRVLASFFGIVAVAIVAVGYLLNAIT